MNAVRTVTYKNVGVMSGYACKKETAVPETGAMLRLLVGGKEEQPEPRPRLTSDTILLPEVPAVVPLENGCVASLLSGRPEPSMRRQVDRLVEQALHHGEEPDRRWTLEVSYGGLCVVRRHAR